MPNGGYPRQFMARIDGTDLVLHAIGSAVHLRRQVSPTEGTGGSTRTYEDVGSLTAQQVCALLYHLRYWGTSQDGTTFDGYRIEPQFRSADCAYDY